MYREEGPDSFSKTHIQPAILAVDILLGKPMTPQDNLTLAAGLREEVDVETRNLCREAIKSGLASLKEPSPQKPVYKFYTGEFENDGMYREEGPDSFSKTHIQPVIVAVDILLGKPMPPKGNLALAAGLREEVCVEARNLCREAIKKSLGTLSSKPYLSQGDGVWTVVTKQKRFFPNYGV